MQAIWCLKLWNITKSGEGQFASAFPSLQILEDSSPRSPWFAPMSGQVPLGKVYEFGGNTTHSCIIRCHKNADQNCFRMSQHAPKNVYFGRAPFSVTRYSASTSGFRGVGREGQRGGRRKDWKERGRKGKERKQFLLCLRSWVRHCLQVQVRCIWYVH